MKKSLYVSIALGIAALSVGTLNNTTVKADEVTVEENASVEQTTKDVQETNGQEPGNDGTTLNINGDGQKVSDVDSEANDDVTQKPSKDVKIEEPSKEDNQDLKKTVDAGDAQEETEEPAKENTWNASDDLDDESRLVSSGYTAELWSRWGSIKYGRSQTSKNLKLTSMLEAGIDFIKIQDPKTGRINYHNRQVLDDFIAGFEAEYAKAVALDEYDYGNVIPVTHHSNHSNFNSIPAKTTDTVDLNITTIKQARLYNEDGKVVKSREAAKKSSWHADKFKMINGQKMYRISENEWISADDVE